MMANGDGFKLGYRNMLYALGKDVVIVWGGRTAAQAGGQRAGLDVRLTYRDVQAIREECFLVNQVTPELSRTLTASSAFNSGTFSTHGVTTAYQEIRSMRLAGGRLLNPADEAEARLRCLIGDAVRKQLFAERLALGAAISIGGIPCTVVGVVLKKTQITNYSTPDDQTASVPYSTLGVLVDVRYLHNIVIRLVSNIFCTRLINELRATLARLHNFNLAMSVLSKSATGTSSRAWSPT